MADPAIQSASDNNGGVSSWHVAFGSNNTAGNTIAVCSWSDSFVDTSCTDSAGNSYSFVTRVTISNGQFLAIYAAFNVKGAANTVTVHYGGSTDQLITIIELPPAGAVRVFNSAQAAGSSSPSVTLAGTVNNDVCVANVFAGTTAQTSPVFGSNAGFIEAPLFTSTIAADGNSSGGNITVATTGVDTVWAIIALALGPGTGDAIFFSNNF